jgi:hypothetical protein
MQVTVKSVLQRWLMIALIIYCSLAFMHIFWGRLTGDEGFYALSARNVLRGMRPYRDFMFLQMPLLPYVYGGWFYLVGTSVESGRILSAIFGASSIVLMASAAVRRGGMVAGVLAAFLCACNLNFVFDMCTLKTQPLTVFLTSCAIFVLAKENPRSLMMQAGLAMLFISLALLERLSILPALVVLWIYLGFQLRVCWRRFICLLAANVILILGLVGFFWADGNMFFGVYQFHRESCGFEPWTWSRHVPTVLGWIGNQLPIIFCFVVASAAFVGHAFRGGSQPDSWRFFFWFLLLAYWAVTAVHWANVQSYPTHQTSITAFAVVFCAGVLADIIRSIIRETGWLAGFAFAALLGLSMPFQTWIVNFNGQGSMKKIRDTVSIIRRFAQEGDSILSFNAELAVNGGFRVPEGYELSEFTYFAEMTEERRAKFKATNLNKLTADISSRRYRVLCVGDREFDLMSSGDEKIAQRLRALIDQDYQCIGGTTGYGQFFEPLYVFVLGTDSAERQ